MFTAPSIITKELEEIGLGALAWSSGSGRKVIIVIDDNYKDALKERSRDPYGWGLSTLWREISEWEETRAIGFFYLPKEESELKATRKQITEWVNRFPAACTYYFVLDVFSGHDLAFPIGVNLAELLISDNNVRLKKGRLAFFSTTGWTDDLVQKKFEAPVFEKQDFRKKVTDDFWEWLGKCIGLEGRIWQAGTEEWFEKDEPSDPAIAPHNWSVLQTDKDRRKACREAFRIYLTRLLSYAPPEPWLNDQQFEHLFSDLMHLVGACCRAHLGDHLRNGHKMSPDRNLTLGNVMLLLAAATGDCSSSWINSISWNKSLVRRQILPLLQTQEQSRAAILALADGLFPPLARHDDTREPLIDSVNLTERLLSIRLKFNCTVSTKEGRMSLLEKIQSLTNNHGGQVYLAYKKFLVMSALAQNAREARCVMNLRPSDDKPECSILEIEDVHKRSCS